MEKIDFLYVAGMHSDQHVPALSDYFREHRKKYLVVTENFADYVKWRDAGVSVFFISTYKKPEPSKLSGYVETRLGLDNIVETEFRYYSLPRVHLFNKFFRLCNAVEELLEKYDICRVIQKPGGEILRRIFFNLPGVRTVCFGESYFNGYSTLYLDEYKTPIKSLCRKESGELVELLNETLGSGSEVKYTARLKDFSQSKIKRLLLLLSARGYGVLLSFLSHRLKLKPFGVIRKKLTLWFLSRNMDALSDQDKKVFYFPLNVKAESELYVRNYILAEQAVICQQLKKLLPGNAELIVKEHPGNSKSLGFLEMYKLWRAGVFIVRADTPSSKVLERCDGVVAVSSTVLIEAIEKKKPVLILGSWPYSKFFAGRNSENSALQVVSYFQSPDEFVVELEAFAENAGQYLHKGAAYSSLNEFKELLESIMMLDEEPLHDT